MSSVRVSKGIASDRVGRSEGRIMVAVSSLPLYLQCPRAFFFKATLPKRKDSSAGKEKTSRSTSRESILDTRTKMLESAWLSLRGQCRFLMEDGVAYPSVFRKRGGYSGEPDPEDTLKLACYSLLLDNCPDGRIVYTDTNQISRVQITGPMRDFAQNIVRKAAELLADDTPPAGRKGDSCRFCRYKYRCQTSPATTGHREIDNEPWIVPEDEESELPSNEKRLPLYLQEQGTKLSLEGEAFIITRNREKLLSVMVMDVSQVCVYGNIQVTTQVFRKAFDNGIPILFFTGRGVYTGTARGLAEYNSKARLAQFKAIFDEKRAAEIALRIVTAKISNCKTLLRRNSTNDTSTSEEMTRLLRRMPELPSHSSLRGIEGTAARMYFQDFRTMLKDKALSEGFDFGSRNRRPPKDPINSLLSFGYALLAKEFTVVIDASGLDPMHGYYHSTRPMRPALALDLMEPFRPLISDSLAITCVNRGMLKRNDFKTDSDGCNMKPTARKKYLEAYENRLNTKVSYNGSGAISYRNAIRKAVHDFKNYLLGRSAAYCPLVVR